MKRIMQRVLIVVAVLAVVIGIAVYFLTHDPDKPNGEQLAAVPTVTDAAGTTYGVVVNEQGTTYVVVTDEQTNRYMAEFDGVTAGSTVAKINDDIKADDLPTNYTGPGVSVSQNINDYMGEVVTDKADDVSSTTAAKENQPSADVSGNQQTTTVAVTNGTTNKTPGITDVAGTATPTQGTQAGTTGAQVGTTGGNTSQNATTSAAQGNTNPTTSKPSSGTTAPGATSSAGTTAPTTKPATNNPAPNTQQAYRIKKYEEIFKTGTFVMTVTMNDPEYPEPVTMALKNGNIYIETAMAIDEGEDPLRMKMLYLKNTDTMYMLLVDLKKYCKLPEEMVEEFDMSSMVSDFQITTVGEIKVSEAQINGKNLIVESYVNEAGETVNYYFDGDNIVRLDTISKKGKTDSVYYSQFSTDVSDSYFTIPEDYGYWNLSWMGALM